MQSTYSLPSGHTLTESSITPITIYTESEVDYVDPGKVATDSNGNRFLIIAVNHMAGRLYRVTMLPQEAA